MIAIICGFVLGLQAPGSHVYSIKSDGFHEMVPFTISLDDNWYRAHDVLFINADSPSFERKSPRVIDLYIYTVRNNNQSMWSGYVPARSQLVDHEVEMKLKRQVEVSLYWVGGRRDGRLMGLVEDGKLVADLEFVHSHELDAGIVLKAIKGLTLQE